MINFISFTGGRLTASRFIRFVKNLYMCYINGVRVSLAEFIRYKQHQKELKQLTAAKLFYQPVKRCFDYTEWPIIQVDGSGKDWDAVPMEWGIISQRIQSRVEANAWRLQYLTYNAIGAELLDKDLYKTPARKNRCLVPSSYFFESMHVPKIGKKGQPLQAYDSIPFEISVIDEPLFYFAGIYSPWFDREKDEWINTFSICTADAGHIMKQIHNSRERQPTKLTAELAERWTDKDLKDKEIIEIASYQFDNNKFAYHTVKKKFWEDENPTEEVHYDNVPEIKR